MLRRYQSLLGKLYATLDGIAVILALLAAWLIRFRTPLLPQHHALPFTVYMSILIYAVPSFIAGAALFGLYGTTRNSSWRVLGSQLAKASLFMVLVIMSVLFFDKQVHYSRAVLIFFVGLSWGMSLFARVVLQRALKSARKRGLNRKYLVFVGATKATNRFLDHIHLHPEFGFSALGYIAITERPASALEKSAASDAPLPESAPRSGPAAQLDYLGTVHDLDKILSEHIVDHLVLTVAPDESRWLPQMLRIAESHGVHAIFVPDFLGILPAKPRIEEFAGLPIIDPDYTPLDEAVNVMFKRAFDIVFSACVLVLGSPVLATIALVVRLSSPGPVVYSQERLGKNRRPFKMYKFRTMWLTEEATVADRAPDLAGMALDGAQDAALSLPHTFSPAESYHEAARTTASATAGVGPDDYTVDEGWTVANDPRRTPIGKFLRSTSLDELPQFWNVLKGDMSVIGPRPERPQFVEQFREDVPMYMLKHRVRPGITGWAQVNGLRGDTSIEERIQYDLRYIEEWSFLWDLRIVALTVVKGFRDKNAY